MSKQTKQKKRMQKLGLALLMSIILFSSYVSAFGVGCAYHRDYPLELSPGETREIIFNLQNMPGPENITTIGSITKGAEIIELIDSGQIFVPVGGSVDVIARVSIPDDAEIGDVYPVEVTFTTITEAEAGAFGLGSSVGRNFDVVIIPTAEERARLSAEGAVSSWVYLIVAIVILIIILIIWFSLKKRKNKLPTD